MKSRTIALASALVAFSSSATIAQSPAGPAPASAAPQLPQAQVSPAAVPVVQASIAPRPAGSSMLREGTAVPLKLAEALSTEHKDMRVGQRVQLEVAEAVTLNGQVVIPVGSPATGEITTVRNKGMWGKAGKFTGRLLYVRVGDRQIRLRGQFDEKGTAGGVGAVAVSAIVFLPAGFFMTGRSARLPLGTPIGAFLDEDVLVMFDQPAPAPLALHAVAPAAAPATSAVPASGATPQAVSTAPPAAAGPPHH